MMIAYDVLNVMELIVLGIFAVFAFLKRDGKNAAIMRIFTISGLFLINLIELPMEINIGKSYGMTIFLIGLWGIDLALNTYKLGKNN